MMAKEKPIMFTTDILDCPEAAKMWGTSEATIKRLAGEGKFLPTEAMKKSRFWIITRQGMERLFGAPKNMDNNPA